VRAGEPRPYGSYNNLKYGDFGSGYPSDPKTKAFLKENWKKYPEIFRVTWSSYKKVAQPKLGDF